MVRSVVTTYASDTLAHAAAGLGYAGREARVPRRRKGHRGEPDTFPFGDLPPAAPVSVRYRTTFVSTSTLNFFAQWILHPPLAPTSQALDYPVPFRAERALRRNSLADASEGPSQAFHAPPLRPFAVAKRCGQALVVAFVLIPSAFAYADLAPCSPAAAFLRQAAGMVVFASVHQFASRRRRTGCGDRTDGRRRHRAVVAADDPGKAVTLPTVLAFLTGGVLLLIARLRLGITTVPLKPGVARFHERRIASGLFLAHLLAQSTYCSLPLRRS